ncbi:MAG: hypothetical protein ACKV1O_09095 [Saprospiraceae bacterium]
MGNFTYFELIAFFYYGVFDQVKQGTSFEMAVNSSFDNFWSYPEYEHRLPNLIIQIQYLHIKYSFNKSFTSKQVEVYKKQLELIKNDDLSTMLNEDELYHLNELIEILDNEIKSGVILD